MTGFFFMTTVISVMVMSCQISPKQHFNFRFSTCIIFLFLYILSRRRNHLETIHLEFLASRSDRIDAVFRCCFACRLAG